MRAGDFSIGLRATLAIFTVALFVTSTWAADHEKVLHSFGKRTDGNTPHAGLVGDGADNLYGTTAAGGIHGRGTVFELTPTEGGDWTETVLHSFKGAPDGQQPEGVLILDVAGNLYGTTEEGGIYGGIYSGGTVFELSPRQGGGWTETVLHSFGNGTDGAGPRAGLIFDADGNLYGTTSFGGIHGAGTAFELSPREGGGWTETVLHSFGNGTDGGNPHAGLIFDAAGNLYGTTALGGIHGSCGYGCGTVFELSPRQGGGWRETVLHSFNNNGSDGYHPRADLIFDAAGNLYGTTSKGGSYFCYDGRSYGCGTVFELSPRQGGGWRETVLHSFDKNELEGYYPYAGLIFDAAGNLYGTTNAGGVPHGAGAVFELSSREGGGWTATVLHTFGNGTDGTRPESGLIFDAAGNLYGTTVRGGIHTGLCLYGCGTVFELTP